MTFCAAGGVQRYIGYHTYKAPSMKPFHENLNARTQQSCLAVDPEHLA